MRTLILLAALLAAPALAQPPREESPASQELLDQLGQGSSDAELVRAIAAAAAHPLGTGANPIRVGGPEGAQAYLARLRCGDGSAPRIGEREAAGVGAYGTIVDAWPIDCGDAAPGTVSLVIDLYHDGHVEQAAPPGFAILP
jgi:hypothetical protein